MRITLWYRSTRHADVTSGSGGRGEEVIVVAVVSLERRGLDMGNKDTVNQGATDQTWPTSMLNPPANADFNNIVSTPCLDYGRTINPQ